MAKEITSTTRKTAGNFVRDHGDDLREEVKGFLENPRMPDMKYIELFSMEKGEFAQRAEGFLAAMDSLAKGGAPDQNALADGLNLVAGMVMITSNAAGAVDVEAKPRTIAKKFRQRNEMTDEDPLSGRDKKIIRGIAAKMQADVPFLDQDAAKWKDAAGAVIDVANAAGLDGEQYRAGLNLGRSPT
jgi:hypothetical protein